jgi:cytochrome P450
MNAARLLETAQAHPLRSGVLLLLFAVVYKSWQAIYRLYLHPLSNFPGPREAALSTTWLFNLSQTGQQEQEFERLHQKYRTHALRIAPNELHLSDVSAYKTIYSQSRPFPKPGSFYGNFGTPHTLFTETDFALHKERRRLLNPFFARSGILKIEPALKKHMEALRLKLCRLSEQGRPIVAHNAFRCVTVDIITEFAFAKSRLLVDGSDDRSVRTIPSSLLLLQ